MAIDYWPLAIDQFLTNFFLFIFIWNQTCFPQVKESHVSSSNNVIISPLSNDEELFEDMDEEDLVIFHCMVIACNLHNFFTSHEIAERIGQIPFVGPKSWCSKSFGYNAIRTTSLENFDRLHFGKVWWIGNFNGSNNLGPCTIYKWSLISSLGFHL